MLATPSQCFVCLVSQRFGHWSSISFHCDEFSSSPQFRHAFRSRRSFCTFGRTSSLSSYSISWLESFELQSMIIIFKCLNCKQAPNIYNPFLITLNNFLFYHMNLPPSTMKSYEQAVAHHFKQRFLDAINLLQNALAELDSTLLNPEEPPQDSFLISKSIILHKLADIYLDLNNPTQAIHTLVKCLKIEKNLSSKQLPDSFQRVALAYAKIGKSCFYTCNYTMSFQFLNDARTLLETNGLQDTPEMALTYAQLGNYYRFMFKDDDSEKSLDHSLEIRARLFGTESSEYAESLHGLAQLYSDTGNLEGAMEMIDRAISIYKKRYSRNHIRTAKSLYLKGNLYLRMQATQANLRSAEEYISESLEINQGIVGERFLETADCYHSLGKIKAQSNKPINEFKEYFMKALAILEELYGKAHACIAILLNNLGRAYYDRSRYEDAVACFERSIGIYQVICGETHGNLAITLKSCADCHKNLGRMKQAHQNYIQSLSIYEVGECKIETDYSYTMKQIKQLIQTTQSED